MRFYNSDGVDCGGAFIRKDADRKALKHVIKTGELVGYKKEDKIVIPLLWRQNFGARLLSPLVAAFITGESIEASTLEELKNYEIEIVKDGIYFKQIAIKDKK